MVSPFFTLQSSNSLRNSIASLAWFSASCIRPSLARLYATFSRRCGNLNSSSRQSLGGTVMPAKAGIQYPPT